MKRKGFEVPVFNVDGAGSRTAAQATALTVAVAGFALHFLAPSPAAPQTCFAYVDGINTDAPLECVQKPPLSGSCGWPTDCTSIVSSTSQTNLEMHTLWHECFGNVGGPTPPAGRGQRWYAFHRQFEYDFNLWRMDTFPVTDSAGRGRPIESVDWCPPRDTDSDGTDDTFTVLRVGHDGAGIDGPSSACGTGDARPWNNDCNNCVAFPQCLFRSGGGPMDCPGSPGTSCSGGSVTFPHTSLEDFANVDDVAKILDATFHGDMHEAVSDGDETNWGTLPFNNDDASDPNCSPRDPMFWRLHKALDDVVRDWQNLKAVDVMLVIDTSGSMDEIDASGKMKLERALEASEYFAKLMDNNRADSQQNRIGIVTYASTASVALGLTPATAGFADPGTPFANAIAAIDSAGPGGCTAIGAGLVKALEGESGKEGLCSNSGDCRLNAEPPPSGTNARKAVLLLTDGFENRPPCLSPASATPGGSCGTICNGPPLEYDNLEFTQMVALGYGAASGLNGDLLTLVAERQGGIYANDPDGSEDDLKYFFTMAFGGLTDEFVFVDPRGLLGANEAATEFVEYNSCGDGKLTFTSGWKDDVTPGELRLMVTDPAGDLVRDVDPGVQGDTDGLWSLQRVPLPRAGGASRGKWQAQLVRRHAAYVNGFAPDAFADPKAGAALVRRQIQRLCPDGCERVLLFEKGLLRDPSAYALAVEQELATGLLASVERTDSADNLSGLLKRRSWDLLVYSRTGKDAPEPYDSELVRQLCRGQRAVLTDTRPKGSKGLFKCVGTQADKIRNWEVLEGDGKLWEGALKMDNPGYDIATHGLTGALDTQATANSGRTRAVLARTVSGDPQHWFIDVLGTGMSSLSPVLSRPSWKTGEPILASVRILPSSIVAGGYDHVDARVEVEYPKVGVGRLLAKYFAKTDESEHRGETFDRRTAALAVLDIPTGKAVFPLNDDGINGDLNPANGQWSGWLPGTGTVDGTYHLRYILDLTVDGCTTRRELAQSIIVELATDPDASDMTVIPGRPSHDGSVTTVTTITPSDLFGNLVGPGADLTASCSPKGCRVEKVDDLEDGSYRVVVVSASGIPALRLKAFGADFDIALPCPDCPRLAGLEVLPRTVPEHSTITGRLKLSDVSRRSPQVVFLTTNDPLKAAVPESVTVPPGASEAEFEVRVFHAHQGPVEARITARYGNDVRSVPLRIRPLKQGEPDPLKSKARQKNENY